MTICNRNFPTGALDVPDSRSIGKPGFSDGYIRRGCQADVTVNYVLAPDVTVPTAANLHTSVCGPGYTTG